MEEHLDDEVMDCDEVANFIVYYELDDSDTAHYLSVLDYMACADAPTGA